MCLWKEKPMGHGYCFAYRLAYTFFCYCFHSVAKPCLTLCDPMDCSPPGSSVYGLSQAGILEWVAITSSWVSSQPRDQTHISCDFCTVGGFFTTEPPGKPPVYMCVCTYMYHIFFIHSSVDGNLDDFHILAIVNNAAMNARMHVAPHQNKCFQGF